MARLIPGNLPLQINSASEQSSPLLDSRPLSPEACNRSIKSFSSTSTLDSIVVENNNSPPLPALMHVNVIELYKRPADVTAPGWGLKLRGTTSQVTENLKVYTCHVETVQEQGAAKEAGLKEGDQIVCVDDQPVQKFTHEEIIAFFQATDRIVLTVLPTKFRMEVCNLLASTVFLQEELCHGKEFVIHSCNSNNRRCSQARILKRSYHSLNYLWALMQHLQVLEIINVNLGNDSTIEVNLTSLIFLVKLSVHHCSLKLLSKLNGLDKLGALESLSLAYNLLQSEEISSFDFTVLKQLKALDLGRNILDRIPENICKISSLQSLVLVDNNIIELPQKLVELEQLETLCLDGNFLHEIDAVLKSMESVRNLTISNNHLECESEVVKLSDLSITCIEGNPFASFNSDGIISRNEPTLRRTLSVRGHIVVPRNRHSLEWDGPISELITDGNYAIGSQ